MDRFLLEEIRKVISPFLTSQAVELVDVVISRQRGKACLRFLVDKTGSITLDECAHLNQQIGQILEARDIIREAYILEVSSPGLDRPLKSTGDFQRHQDKLVKFALHQPINGQNVWIGFVNKVDEKNVVIRTEKEKELCIARNKIAWARPEVRV